MFDGLAVPVVRDLPLPPINRSSLPAHYHPCRHPWQHCAGPEALVLHCLQWINQSKYCILDNGQDEEDSEIGALREGVSVY
jgi:hypothetical protein